MSIHHLEERCWECRRRRLVCDLRRPGCLKCAKSEMKCPGYGPENKPLRFVEPNRIKSHARRRVPGSSTASSYDVAISTINHREVERAQLLEAFISTSFPAPALKDPARTHSILHNIQVKIDQCSPVLLASVEALCLTGATRALPLTLNHQQSSARSQADKAFGQTLRLINNILSTWNSRTRYPKPNQVVMALVLLQMRNHILGEAEMRIRHLCGSSELMDSCGPNDVHETFRKNFREQNLLLKMVNPRKWQELKIPRWFAKSSLPPWHVCAEALPGLLKETDHVCSHDMEHQSVPDPAALYFAIDCIRTQLLQLRVRDLDRPKEWYHAPFNLAHLNLDIEEHAFIRSRTASPIVAFATGETSYIRETALLRLAILFADVALIRLHRHASHPEQHSDDYWRLQENAIIIAQELCTFTWYLANLSPSMAWARFLQILLLAAESTFKSSPLTPELLEWTQGCLQATLSRIQRLTRAGSFSFCFVGEAIEDVASRCDWNVLHHHRLLATDPIAM